MPVTVPVVPVLDAGVSLRERFVRDAPTSCAPPKADPQAPINGRALLVSSMLAALSVGAVWALYGAKFGALLAVGLALGFALFHSRFGFTSGWRQLVTVGNGEGLRAQFVLLGTAASAVSLVIITGWTAFGPIARPVPAPVGFGLVLGAALFGAGMQLAGSCASGTLFAVGSGQSTIVLALGGFMAGGVFYTWAYPVFAKLPTTRGLLLADHVGWIGSWAVTLAALAVLAVITRRIQHRRLPPPTAPVPTAHGIARLYRGSWSPLVGALVLGVLAGVVFLFSGRTWGIAAAFSLWGAKLLQLIGLHPQAWAFWQQPANAAQINAPLLTNAMSLTNFGIMIGAAFAAAAAGAWTLHSRVAWRTALASLMGGLMMGLGARMSGGCNIGAFLSGISVGNVSGWVWGCAALLGTVAGVKLRPVFGLLNPKSTDGIC
ncbi:MAG: uncharacterized protein QOH97_1197 [Actinoplanes sp.]|nr:uncharacterized protein [Actinoplanes sp.]